MNDWIVKRDRAEVLETLVIEFFNKNFNNLSATKIPNPTSEECKDGAHPPDILINRKGGQTTIEIKEDHYSLKSGNLCFEAEAIYKCENQGGDIIMYFSRAGDNVYCFDMHELVQELHGQNKYLKSHVGNVRSKGPNPAWCIPINKLSTFKSFIPLSKLMSVSNCNTLRTLYKNS